MELARSALGVDCLTGEVEHTKASPQARRAERQAGGESMFRWLRLGDDAAYADHRWNLYGTFSGTVTVAARDTHN